MQLGWGGGGGGGPKVQPRPGNYSRPGPALSMQSPPFGAFKRSGWLYN